MLEIWKTTIPQLSGGATRRVYVWLPASYRQRPAQRYPVLYMFDGHNVFFDSHATYGKSWGMGDYLRATDKELIVVAVECNHAGHTRLSEYSPVDFEAGPLGTIEGRGRAYMDWLTGELKPLVDARYRTLPDREHTAICGSSMGGLMALYGATVYNHLFRRAACLSPSLWADPAAILSLVEGAALGADTCIYMDYGSRELPCHPATVGALGDMTRLLLERGVHVTCRVVPGGEHCEATWERQIPIFMACLGL